MGFWCLLQGLLLVSYLFLILFIFLIHIVEIQVVYLEQNTQNHTFFQLQYIEVIKNEENLSLSLINFERSRAAILQQKHREKIFQVTSPYRC